MTTIAVRNFHTIPSVKWPTSVSMNGWSMLPSNAPSKFGTSKPQGFREDPGNAWDLHENISDMMVGLSRTEALILSIHIYICIHVFALLILVAVQRLGGLKWSFWWKVGLSSFQCSPPPSPLSKKNTQRKKLEHHFKKLRKLSYHLLVTDVYLKK